MSIDQHLDLTPWHGLIEVVNESLGVLLVADSTTVVNYSPRTDALSTIVLKTNQSTSSENIAPPVPEQITFNFQRLNIGSYFASKGYSLNVPYTSQMVSTIDVVNYLSEVTGIAFSLNDFTHFPLSNVTAYNTITLTTASNSYRWYGSLTIQLVYASRYNLADYVTVKSDANAISDISTGKPSAAYYSILTDFTSERQLLRSVTTDNSKNDAAMLAEILRKVTGDPWVANNEVPSAFNLATSEPGTIPKVNVIYVGPCITPYTPRSDFASVIVLELDELACTGLTGSLLLHYN